MSVGAGVLLFVIGAVLAFAIDVEVPGVDLDLVGYILMGAGLLAFVLGLGMLARRRKSETMTRTALDPTVGEQITRRSTSSTDEV